VEEGHENDPLPFPHARADTLAESIGVPVRWAKRQVHKVGWIEEGVQATDDEVQPGASNPSPKEKEAAVSEEGLDYTQRRYWYFKDVQLFCPDRRLLVGEGLISVHLATSAVNDQVLGEGQVGITLLSALHKEYFPNCQAGDLPTVAWPISCTKLVKDGRFLGDIMQELAHDSDDSIQVLEERLHPQKRAYHSTKRTKMDPQVKVLLDLEKKKNKKLNEVDIKEARSKDCCGLDCCHNTTMEDFKELRSDYWGSSFANRQTYIMSLFHNRPMEVIAQRRMVLKTRLVCKKGFHTIFGFSHTLFYKYESAFLEG